MPKLRCGVNAALETKERAYFSADEHRTGAACCARLGRARLGPSPLAISPANS